MRSSSFKAVTLLSTVFLTSAFALPAQADKVIAKDKDWILTEYSPSAGQPDTTCVASTKEKMSKNTIQLEISAKKMPRAVLEIMIREVGPDFNHTGVELASKDGSRRVVLAPLSKTATTQFFWMVPRNTRSFIDMMNAEKELDVKSVAGTREVKEDFPMSGFVKVMQAMQDLCLSGTVSTNVEFESLFLSGSQQPVDVTRLTPEVTQGLRSIYLQAHKIFLQKMDNRDALAKLGQQYATQLNEMASLTTLIIRLETNDIPKLLSDINSTESLRVRSETDLTGTRAAIPGMEQAVNSSHATLDRAQQIIAPYVDEYNQRLDTLEAAVSAQNRAETRLSQVRNSIDRLQSEIVGLRNEVANLNTQIIYLRNDLVRARQIYNDADRDLRMFDREREYRDRLGRDPSYVNDVRVARDLRSDVRVAETEMGRAQADVSARQAELRACQAVPGQDCSAKQTALTSAEGVLSQARTKLQLLRSQADRADERVANTERRIRRDVDSDYETLARRERDARSRVNDLENQVATKQNRISQITNSEIPYRMDQINSLSNEEASLVRSIPLLRADVARSTSEFNSFKLRSGWDQKKSSLDNAQADFDRKTSTLANAREHETDLVRTIESCKSKKILLDQKLVDARALLANSKTRQAVVKKSLEPYETERTKLDTTHQALIAQVQSMGRDFESKLPR